MQPLTDTTLAMAPAHWLRILVYQNLPGLWAARSLEHDIAVEGTTSEMAIDRILAIVFAHIAFDRRHGRLPLSSFPEAPERYWRAFDTAAPFRSVDAPGHEHCPSRGILIAVAAARPLPPSWRLPFDRHAGLRPGSRSREFAPGPAIHAQDPIRRDAPSSH